VGGHVGWIVSGHLAGLWWGWGRCQAALDGRAQVLTWDWLYEDALRTEPLWIKLFGSVGVTSHHNDRHSCGTGHRANGSRDLHTVRIGQAKVKDYDVRPLIQNTPHGVGSSCGLSDRVTTLRQDFRKNAARSSGSSSTTSTLDATAQ